jgi:ANTAR domain/PAS fold
MTGSDDFVPPSETGTDGVAPGPLDKALLGGSPQRVGRFEYRYDTDQWIWSDAVARMHGYEPGSVQPTTELVLKHKHPDDLAQVKALLKKSSAPFSSRHRIYTTTGQLRTVVVVGEIVAEDGEVVATRGFYVDITKASQNNVHQQLGEQLHAIVADRAVIEQAKGMLMVTYHLDADAAFGILRWRSQELNIKLHNVARHIVDRFPMLAKVDTSRTDLDRFLISLDID